VQFSAWPNQSGQWEPLREFGQHVEATGWDGLWVADHFMPNQADNSGPTGEAWMTLSALAATVPRIRLGTMVTGNTYRHPAVLAKMAAQVDIISGGRLVLGIGSAWQQNEHEAYGIPFHTVGGRLRRLEESVQVLRGLFEQERTTFEGKFYQLDNAPLAPKPVQRPWPRLLIGGGGEQVTMRIAAQYADEWNVWGSPETLRHKIGVLRAHCERLGRDASEIRKSANAMVVITDDASEAASVRERNPRALAGSAAELQGMMQEYIDAGVDELVVPIFTLRGDAGSLEATKAHADRVMAEVASAFR
jgi:F420-dependent oxidoreductase-like protein